MIKKINRYFENAFFIVVSFLLAFFFYGLALIHKLNYDKKLRVLIIQTAKIGDLVCSTPVFSQIKKKYPDSFLAVLVISRVEGVLINNPYIDKIIFIDQKKYLGIWGAFGLVKLIKNYRFNWSLTLLPGILNNFIPFWAGIPNRVVTLSRYTSRGAKILSIFGNYKLEYKRHTLATSHYLKLLKFIGIDNVNGKKEIFTTPELEKKALSFLNNKGLNKNNFLIGISVTAGNEFKEWSLNKFSQLADKLIDQYRAKIVFIGSSQDKVKISEVRSKMKNQSIDTSQSFELSEAPALFKRLNVFISVDTGSLYMANAMNVPVVNIAGPIDIYEQPPLNDKCIIVQKKLNCLPCSFVLPPARFCHKGDKRCIKEISVDDVFEAVNTLIKDNKIKTDFN